MRRYIATDSSPVCFIWDASAHRARRRPKADEPVGTKCRQEAARAGLSSRRISKDNNAAVSWRLVATLADLGLGFFVRTGPKRGAAPAVFGLQASFPTDEGAAVLRHVQTVRLLWPPAGPGADVPVLPNHGPLWFGRIWNLCWLRVGPALPGRHADKGRWFTHKHNDPMRAAVTLGSTLDWQ